MEFISIATPAGTLPGCNSILDPRTAGIASLNRRLMAGNPLGCRIARAENTWRLLVCPLKDKTWLASDTKGINPFARRRRWHGIFVRRAQMERANRPQKRDKERADR